MDDDMFKKMPQNKTALKHTQKTWLKFRDASCELILTLGMASSDKEGMMNSCLVKITMQRNDELEALIEDFGFKILSLIYDNIDFQHFS